LCPILEADILRHSVQISSVWGKLNVGEAPNDDSKTFLAEVENLGYEATGKPKPGSEVQKVVVDFHRQVGW
jgi:type I restriction enzyme M protein